MHNPIKRPCLVCDDITCTSSWVICLASFSACMQPIQCRKESKVPRFSPFLWGHIMFPEKRETSAFVKGATAGHRSTLKSTNNSILPFWITSGGSVCEAKDELWQKSDWFWIASQWHHTLRSCNAQALPTGNVTEKQIWWRGIDPAGYSELHELWTKVWPGATCFIVIVSAWVSSETSPKSPTRRMYPLTSKGTVKSQQQH